MCPSSHSLDFTAIFMIIEPRLVVMRIRVSPAALGGSEASEDAHLEDFARLWVSRRRPDLGDRADRGRESGETGATDSRILIATSSSSRVTVHVGGRVSLGLAVA